MPKPSEIITPTKEKFTDWIDSSPEPSGPKRLTCKKVPMPEATIAIDTR